MDLFLLTRQIGQYSPLNLYNAQIYRLYSSLGPSKQSALKDYRHHPGILSLALEQNDYKYLLSGGAEGSVQLWDATKVNRETVMSPIAQVSASPETHQFGISKVTWWPSDTGLFTTSSFDTTLKVWDTNSMGVAKSFDVGAKLYSHAVSSTGHHNLIACASDSALIRLYDLRLAVSAHVLSGHSGSVLTIRWHPVQPYVVASGGTDGTLRLWDVRRAASCLTSFDLHNTVYQDSDRGSFGTAHSGSINGLCWAQDGMTLLSCGHDQQMRVWDCVTGENTLTNFGPRIQNTFLKNNDPLLVAQDRLIVLQSDAGALLIFDINGDFVHTVNVPLRGARLTSLVDNPILSVSSELFKLEADVAGHHGIHNGWSNSKLFVD